MELLLFNLLAGSVIKDMMKIDSRDRSGTYEHNGTYRAGQWFAHG